jgi:nucleotide-binding universal stress UspA family protein
MTKQTIVVGADGSHESARAVQWCADHATSFGAEVVVVHAVDITPYALYAEFGFGAMPVLPSPEDRDEVRDTVARDWCKPLADAGVDHRVVVVDGNAAAVLKLIADREDATLVVVGRRGRGGFTGLLLGSTSHQLAQHVGRPLLIVP